MKIIANQLDALRGKATVDERAKTPDAKASAAPAASVNETQAFSSRIHDMRQRIVAGDAIDHAKVERIAKSIADGTFRVNAEVVADRMLQSAADLMAKPK